MVFRRELSLEWDFDNTGDGPLQAPGFGVAVDLQLPYRDRLAHGANDFKQSPPLTAKEVAMLGVMNALTDKLDWHEKILDDEIADRWGEEALAVPLMSREAWEWCLLELREKAARFQKTGRVTVLDGASRVSKSDSKVPETLNQELRVALQPLLNQPADQQDWHPGSDGQVLNLVHPSLFPLIFGKTKVLMDGGIVPLDIGSASSFENAKVSPLQPPADSLASNKFQWLPCEVEFAEDAGPDVEITSYINNLHPKHKDVYTCIEKIISLTIPAWNEVLVDGHDGRTPPRIRTYGAQFDGELPDWYKGLSLADKKRKSEPEVYKEARRKVAAFCKFKDLDEEDEELKDDDEIDIEDESTSVNEDDFGPEYVEEHGLAQTVQEYSERHVRKVLHPEPGVSFTYTQWKAGLTGKGVVPSYRESYHVDSNWNGDEQRDHNYYSLRIQDDFRDEGLQVIVKLASIELTPEKPTYGGGSWHVEGLLNEHIAATALYYYDVGNIIEARISFRAETFLDEMTMQYAQNDHQALAEIFGLRSGNLSINQDAIQNLGSVTTPQGRLLTFPNTLQHKVEPFELVDKSRPGHRRFLALWLVDPQYRVCSTRNVPPQQEHWWRDGLAHSDDEGLMSLEEAKRLRLDLMAERTKAVETVHRGVETYNFCEH